MLNAILLGYSKSVSVVLGFTGFYLVFRGSVRVFQRRKLGFLRCFSFVWWEPQNDTANALPSFGSSLLVSFLFRFQQQRPSVFKANVTEFFFFK